MIRPLVSAQNQKITVKNQFNLNYASGFNVFQNPLTELHRTLKNISSNDNLKPFLHNRFEHPKQLKIGLANGFAGMNDKNGNLLSPKQLTSISQEYVKYKRLDKHIFQNLLMSVLGQTMERFTNFQSKFSTENLTNFVADCVQSFYRLLTYLKFTASENNDGELLSAPHGRLAISKLSVFQNMTLSDGMNHAEFSFMKTMPVLGILNKFSEYQLIISYLMVFVHTIDSSIIAKYPTELLVIIQAVQQKVVDLCKSNGLYEECQSIVTLAKWWQEVDYKNKSGFKLFG